jgi:hypothetical protein
MSASRKVHRPSKRRRGVTLIEAVLYIAVSLALIVGGLVFFQQASLLTKVNESVQVLGSIVAEARAVSVEGRVLAANGFMFENVLLTRGAVPQSFWDAAKPSGQRLRLPFSNSYASMNVSFGGAGPNEILLTMVDIPISMCARAGTSSNRSGLVGPGVQDIVLKNSPDDPVSTHVSEAPPALMANLCKSRDTDGDGRVLLRMNFRTWS